MLARLQGGAYEVEVGGGGGRDRHRGDGGISEHLLVGGRGLDGRVAAEDRLRPFLVEIAEPLQLERRSGDCGPDEVRPPVASADYAPARLETSPRSSPLRLAV